MKTARVLYHLARADFLERVRRYSFLLILAFAVALGYLTYQGQVTLQLGDYRGVYNSAWVGSMMTLVTTVFISMTGFYMVKNTIQRDAQTRVGLVLATTPMSRSVYVLGKALSNFAVLVAMVAVLAAAALALQIAHGEGGAVEPGKLLAPFVWVALPAMAVTAAVAVLFETLPVLRGGAGNVIYLFAWATYLGASGVASWNDYLGMGFFMLRMTAAVKAVDPAYREQFTLQVGPTVTATKTFLWNGVVWSPDVLAGRLLWIVVAVALAWFAALFFHRFDPARERGPAKSRLRARLPAPQEKSSGREWLRLPTGIVFAELRLMLKGRSWWWYLVAAGLFAASLVVREVGPFCWLWPVLVWSQMGAREARFDTRKLVFSCAHVLDRQLPAMWAAGVIVAIATGAGVGIHLAIVQDWTGLAAWMAGALFVPSFALAAGVWSGSSRLFEALYTMWWYIGPMNHVRGLNFMSTAPLLYFTLTLGLVAAAYFGRRRELGYA